MGGKAAGSRSTFKSTCFIPKERERLAQGLGPAGYEFINPWAGSAGY
jgi:hypothetical protein